MLVTSLPPLAPGIGGAAITGYQLLATIFSYSNETNPQTATQYSKFVPIESTDKTQKMISSKDGMTMIYLPAFIATSSVLALGFNNIIPVSPSLAGAFVNMHFLKRLYEVFKVHKYSGKVSQGISAFIGTYYALIAVLISCVATPTPSIDSQIIGTVLFVIGLAGNYYHHSILAELRKNNASSTKYVAPKGGFFNYVAAPHYLFELVGWLGIAVISEHGNAFLVFASMSSYLSGRSVSQNRWNKEQFSGKDWPQDRKNIVPFLF
jgi:very-long-chain enoyl-CoA reductase